MSEKTQHVLSPLRILVADDSLMQQALAVRLLEAQGHDVTVANNGRDAVAAACSGDFGLILMDVEMPEMDGLEATRAIREQERETGSHIPIIAVTSISDRKRCFAAGMDSYVAKPMQPKMLLTTIAVLLGKRQRREDEPCQCILLADDDPQIIEPLRYALEACDYRVIVAGDGEQAVRLTRKHHPDLLVLDVMMPKQTGLSVLQELQGTRFVNRVIIVTGTEDKHYKASAMSLGVKDYLHKPFPPNRLIETVKRLLAA